MLHKFADISLIAAAVLGVFILVFDIVMRHTWNIVIDALWLSALICVVFGVHRLRKLIKGVK